MSQEMNTAGASFAQALAYIHNSGNRLATEVQVASVQQRFDDVMPELIEVEQHLHTLQEAFIALRRRVIVEAPSPSLEGRSPIQRVLIGLHKLTAGTADKKVKLTAAGKAAGGLSEANVLSVNEQKLEFFNQANVEIALTEVGVAEAERIIFGGN